MQLHLNPTIAPNWLIIASLLCLLILVFTIIKHRLYWKKRFHLVAKFQNLSKKTEDVNSKLLKKIALLEKHNKDLKETSNYLKDNAQNIGMQIAIEMFACKNVPELDEYLIGLTKTNLEDYHPLTHYKTLKVLEENLPNLDKEKLIKKHNEISFRSHEEIISDEETEKIRDMEVRGAVHEQNHDSSEETLEQDVKNLKTDESLKTEPLKKICSCMKSNPNPSGICQNCTNPIK